MDEPEASADSPDAQSSNGGGIGDFLTSTRGILTGLATFILAISGLITALNQAGVIGGDHDEEAATTGETQTATTREAVGLFAPATRQNGRVYFDGESMYIKASTPRRPFLHLAERDEPLEDVAISARVVWISGADDYGVGLVCRYRDAKNYYLLSVLSGGRYNIVRYRNGSGRSLTGGIQEGGTSAEGSNDISARCVGDEPAKLTLRLNGRALATVSDADSIDAGTVGVRLGSGESFVTCRFDEFELRFL